MSDLALRYVRKTPGRELTVTVPKGSVTHVHVPDEEAKAHLVTAVLKARCEPGEGVHSPSLGPPHPRLRLYLSPAGRGKGRYVPVAVSKHRSFSLIAHGLWLARHAKAAL